MKMNAAPIMHKIQAIDSRGYSRVVRSILSKKRQKLFKMLPLLLFFCSCFVLPVQASAMSWAGNVDISIEINVTTEDSGNNNGNGNGSALENVSPSDSK